MKNFVSSPAMTERKYLFLNIVMDSLTASRNSLFSLVDNLFISKFTRTIDALPCQSQLILTTKLIREKITKPIRYLNCCWLARHRKIDDRSICPKIIILDFFRLVLPFTWNQPLIIFKCSVK